MKPGHQFAIFFLFSSLLICLASCGDDNAKISSEPKVNITVDTSGVAYAQAATVFTFFKDIAQVPSSNVAVADVIGLISLMDADISSVVETAISGKYPDGMDFICDQEKCVGTSQGSSTDIILKDVDIGGFANPELLLAADLEVKFQIVEPGTLEVCSLKGVKVKTGVSANFDGAILKLDQGIIEELTVDVGMFGSYPNKKCDL